MPGLAGYILGPTLGLLRMRMKVGQHPKVGLGVITSLRGCGWSASTYSVQCKGAVGSLLGHALFLQGMMTLIVWHPALGLGASIGCKKCLGVSRALPCWCIALASPSLSVLGCLLGQEGVKVPLSLEPMCLGGGLAVVGPHGPKVPLLWLLDCRWAAKSI